MLPSVFGENVFDQLINPSSTRDFFSHDFGSHKVNLMKTDVKENDEAYEKTYRDGSTQHECWDPDA